MHKHVNRDAHWYSQKTRFNLTFHGHYIFVFWQTKNTDTLLLFWVLYNSVAEGWESIYMDLLPDTPNCRLCMRRECRVRFPRHRGLAIPTCITACAWRTCRDACCDRSEVGGGEKRSRHTRRMRKPQLCVSGKRPMQYKLAVTQGIGSFDRLLTVTSRVYICFIMIYNLWLCII